MRRYKLHLSYATLRGQPLRARKPEKGSMHARISLVTFERHSAKSYHRQVISSRIFTLSCTLQNDESYCCYHVETARAMTQFHQTLKDFSPPTYKKSCDVSLPNSGKVMAEVRTADISFQHTCSLFRENCAIERNSLESLQCEKSRYETEDLEENSRSKTNARHNAKNAL